MAAVTLLGSVTFDTNTGTHTVVATPALGDLIVIVTANSGSIAEVAPTDNNADASGTYTKIRSQTKTSSADGLQAWVRNARIGSATSTTFTSAPGVTTGGGLGVVKVTGMSRVALAAVRGSGGESNIPVSTVPVPVLKDAANVTQAALSQNPLIGALINGNSAGGAVTPPASWGELAELGYITPATGMEIASRDSGETNSTITWGSVGSGAGQHGSIVVELDTLPLLPSVAMVRNP